MRPHREMPSQSVIWTEFRARRAQEIQQRNDKAQGHVTPLNVVSAFGPTSEFQKCQCAFQNIFNLSFLTLNIGVAGGNVCSQNNGSQLPHCKREYFPYGCTTFAKIRKQKHFWKDNSRHIATTVERMEDHVMFLRPPRWGKSLFLDMLKCYLDFKDADNFDMLFEGTEIYAMKKQLKCRNRYYVMRFDFSIAVEGGDWAVIEHRMSERIQLAVNSFCRRYGLSFNERPGDSALNNVASAIQYVQEALDGEVFVLIDEYDRFANKIMFENPDFYNKVVTGRSGDPVSSPMRSFFETIKMMTNIRSFTVGISPIALADASGANFVSDISAYVGDVVGLTDADVHSALTSIFGDKFTEIDSLMKLIKKFYDGFHFSSEGDPGLTPSLYHTQLCIYFFRQLCCRSDFRQKAIAGTVTVSEMTDSNTKVSDNVINLLIRQSEFAGLISKLYGTGSVAANIVSSFKLGEILSETSSSDLLISFMSWHGLLTQSPDGLYRIPNQVVGDAGGLLHSVVEALDQCTHNVLSVISEPSAAKVWSMNSDIFSKMNTRFDNTISEREMVGFAEVSLKIQAKRENFEVICEGLTVGWKRCDLILIDPVSRSILIVEYKRLRPEGGGYEQDLVLSGKPAHLVPALNVEEANEQLLRFEIAASKRRFHNNAASIRALLADAEKQVLTYSRELCSRPEYASYKCRTAVVIHSTSKIGSGRDEAFCSVMGAWVQGSVDSPACSQPSEV
jgi:hypothetical protein